VSAHREAGLWARLTALLSKRSTLSGFSPPGRSTDSASLIQDSPPGRSTDSASLVQDVEGEATEAVGAHGGATSVAVGAGAAGGGGGADTPGVGAGAGGGAAVGVETAGPR